MNKEITPHVIWKALLIVAALAMLCLALFGCNPVKKVLKDDDKVREVFNEGVKKGWCVNDTIIQSKSDTLISYDTLFSLDFQTDTFTVDREIVRTKIVTKTIKIRDTVTKVITDNSRIDLLQKKLIAKDNELFGKTEQLKQSKEETKAARQARNKWRLYFWLLVAAITGFILRKPILFGVKKLIGIP